MNIILPKNFTLKLKNFSFINFLQFSKRITRPLLWIIFLATIAILSFVWYQSLHQYSWTQEKKDSYRKEYSSQTTFREDRFNSVVSTLQERTQLHKNLPTVKKDIFFGVSL